LLILFFDLKGVEKMKQKDYYVNGTKIDIEKNKKIINTIKRKLKALI